jgi:hypothetical protein
MSHARTTVAALASAGLLLSGCGALDPEPAASHPSTKPSRRLAPEPVPVGERGTPRGGGISPASVNTHDADAVADAVAATMYRYDTRLDNSPMDASRRAEPWLTATYAEALSRPMPGGGGADWIALAAHDGYTTTTVRAVEESGAPADTRTEAFRQRQVLVTAHGDNGWTRRYGTHVLFIHLTRSNPSAPWRVDGVTTA